MHTLTIANAIASLRPGAEFNVRGQDSGPPLVEWLDTSQTQPTNEEILAAIAAQAAMPTLQEKVDALLAGGEALENMKKRVVAKVGG